jgi:hypothetical protein
MKKLIFSFILLSSPSVFAEGGLTQLLDLPDGISMHWNGSIIAGDSYSIAQTKTGKVVQYKKEDNIVIKTNAEGVPTSVTSQEKDKPIVSFVNLVPGSESATKCNVVRNTIRKNEFNNCITVDKKTCAALLQMSGSKDFFELANKVDVCSKLADIEQKAQMRGVLSVEKSNAEAMMKSLNMSGSNFSNSTTQNFLTFDKAAAGLTVSRQYSYLGWAADMCSADIFSQSNFQAPSKVNFERKGAQ